MTAISRVEELVAEATRPTPKLGIDDYGVIAERVRAAGPPSWLVAGLWPGGAYGVIGAEDKAGKSWAALDLAVSVATGTPWLNEFAVAQGPALCFLGEGGERESVRRVEGILAGRGADSGDLAGLRVAFKVPRLRSGDHINEVIRELEAHPARVVIVDPLYLAAAGAKGSDLYQMGEVLLPIQTACQAAGASLVVVTHWTKSGSGTGPERFTGVGPGAWGRVLASAAIEQRRTGPGGETIVVLGWQVNGGEIPEQRFRMRRTVRASDPMDLASPLIYNIEVLEGSEPEPGDDMSPSRRRTLAVLVGVEPPGLTVQEIGDRLAQDGQGRPLKRTTIQTALEDLLALGRVDGEKPGSGLPNRWWIR